MTRTNKKAFTLTEVLISMGIFTVGMALVISVFPLALSYAASNTNKTCAHAAQADFVAQLRLFAADISVTAFSDSSYMPVKDVFHDNGMALSDSAFLYPVDSTLKSSEKPFSVAAIAKRVGGTNDVQVIMFVCRRPGAASRFVTADEHFSQKDVDWTALPEAIQCTLDNTLLTDPLNVFKVDTASADDWYSLLSQGALIVANEGTVFKIEELLGDGKFRVDSFPADRNALTHVRVVPAPVDGGKSPVVAVYEAVVRFGN
ncbi:MAG: prepilin-type N-terminal cleavage/methylation domain-containing protein [Phycisphaerae bacterium]|jgi:prepilin-type N-terminal cleavage/methylation domain-containing protein